MTEETCRKICTPQKALYIYNRRNDDKPSNLGFPLNGHTKAQSGCEFHTPVEDFTKPRSVHSAPSVIQPPLSGHPIPSTGPMIMFPFKFAITLKANHPFSDTPISPFWFISSIYIYICYVYLYIYYVYNIHIYIHT